MPALRLVAPNELAVSGLLEVSGRDGTDLWRFGCLEHGTFDVWGTEVPAEDPWLVWQYSYGVQPTQNEVRFVPDRLAATRCPSCGKLCGAEGPYDEG